MMSSSMDTMLILEFRRNAGTTKVNHQTRPAGKSGMSLSLYDPGRYGNGDKHGGRITICFIHRYHQRRR